MKTSLKGFPKEKKEVNNHLQLTYNTLMIGNYMLWTLCIKWLEHK